MRSTRLLGVSALTLAAAFVAPTPAMSQDGPRQMISAAPLGVIFSVYNVEFERGISPNASVAVSSTYWGRNAEATGTDGSVEANASYVSGDLKARYYPTAALRGFSLGGLVGMTSVGAGARACDSETETCAEGSGRASAASVGVELDYTFLLGDRENFGLAVGIGGKRLIAFDEIDSLVAYPFGRLSVGYAF